MCGAPCAFDHAHPDGLGVPPNFLDESLHYRERTVNDTPLSRASAPVLSLVDR